MAVYNGKITLINVNDGVGKDGVGIASSLIEYALSDNGAIAPEAGWTKYIPEVLEGKYLWTRTTFKLSNEETEVSYSISYLGINGVNGIGISSVRQLYLLTTSLDKTPETPDKNPALSWADTNPVWDNSRVQYLWICTEIEYTNGVKEYSIPYTDKNWRTASEAVEELKADLSSLGDQVSDIQKQIDNAIDTWYIDGPPSLTNPPWGQIEDNETHIGDLYYDTLSGLSYRFLKNEDGTYEWKIIADSAVSEALKQIEDLREELDDKVAIYYSESDPLKNSSLEVKVDDLWIQPDGNFYKCIEKNNQKSWELASAIIEKVSVQYSKNQSNTEAPTSSWSETSPVWEEGYYIWQRTVTFYRNNVLTPEYSEPVCISAAAARGIIISGEQVFKTSDNINYLPESITLTANIQGDLQIKGWYYKVGNTWVSLNNTNLTYTLTHNSSVFLNSDIAVIKVLATNESYYDIISIYKVSDGADGNNGSSAPTVFLTNENITFAANALGQTIGKTVVCNVVAYEGSEKVVPIIGQVKDAPEEMKITVGAQNNKEIPIEISILPNSTLGGKEEQTGVLKIPITYPVVTTLSINWSKINSGAVGEKGENGSSLYTWIKYSKVPNPSSEYEIFDDPTDMSYIGIAYNKTSEEESNNPKDYAWTLFQGVGLAQTKIYYAVSKNGVVPPIEITNLTVREDGLLVFEENGRASLIINNNILGVEANEEDYYFALKNNKISGVEVKWVEDIPEVPKGQFLWTKIVYEYSNGTKDIHYSNSYHGEDGPQGPKGEDGKPGKNANAYSLKINQTEILKFVDNSGNTTISPEILTVSIYKEEPFYMDGQVQITNLNLLNFTVEVYNITTGTWSPISSTEIISLDNTHTFSINLKKLIANGAINSDAAATQLLLNECIIKIAYIHTQGEGDEEETFSLVEFLNVRYGMSKDMAQLSIKANGIVASMQNSKLVFDGTGLTVQNGSFTIRDAEGNKLLYSDNGNLALKGIIYAEGGYFKGELQGATGTFTGKLSAATGTFAGELSAATGSFSGDISAASGIIGGFKIETTRLTSLKTNDKGVPNIILDGESGNIDVENISLGTGAIIKEYIKIGDQVELRRATTSVDSFIRVVNSSNQEILALKADGSMSIGYGNNSIIISGADGSIVSQSFYNGLGWKISNTESIFNDVTVRGSIRASVLEYGETQAIGGALLVRPSSRIIKAEKSGSNTKLTLEQTEGFNVGDYCRIDIQTANSIEHKFFIISHISDKIVTVSGDATGSYGKPIVSFGQINEDKNKNDNVGICINGSLDNSFSTPQSISVFDFNPTTQIITPRIVLGKLPNEESIYGYAAGTYGLYAENVLLKGSLVTQTVTSNSVTYSGISTLYSENAPTSDRYNAWFGKNTGEILLWAGATGTSKEEIENSKFFVDRNGNLFAGSGYFKGTIITDATITASAIETAILRGSNEKPGEPALKIEDAAKGINFTAKVDGEEVTVFEVTKDSIIANVPNFVFNSNFAVSGDGSLVVPNLYVIGTDTGVVTADVTNQQAIMFDKHRISYVTNFKQNELTGTTKGYIDFTSNMIFSPDGTNQILELSNQEVRVKGENTSLYLENSIRYGEIMEYKPVYDKDNILIGYDLYIE